VSTVDKHHDQRFGNTAENMVPTASEVLRLRISEDMTKLKKKGERQPFQGLRKTIVGKKGEALWYMFSQISRTFNKAPVAFAAGEVALTLLENLVGKEVAGVMFLGCLALWVLTNYEQGKVLAGLEAKRDE
jgi:hypothetical protein